MTEVWFFDRVLTTIKKYHMLDKGDTVLVAVSGGPDSVALLYVLKQLEPLYGLSLYIFHLNHEIRGKEADLDAAFVRDIAAKLGIPATLMSDDVPARAQREKLSLEEAAREARYELMEQLIREIGFNKIALGHHADDQVETFLMRLIRGAGLDGLSAIAPVRDHYIRPFIELSKEDILRFIDESGYDYRLDASNEDTSILRNRIRHELIPLLTDYNPQFKGSTLKTIETVREDQSHLDDLTTGVLNALADTATGTVRVPIQGVVARPKAIQRRLVRMCIKRVKFDLRGVEFKHVEAILEGLQRVPARIEIVLPGGIVVYTEYENLVFASKQAIQAPVVEPVEVVVPGTTVVAALGIGIEAEYTKPGELVFERNGHIAHLDADTLLGRLEIRTRKPGDSFRPFGLGGEKKLQDFLVDEKVPKRERDRIAIITSGSEIVWVAGYRIDDRFKVTGTTKRVLVLRTTRKI